MATQLVKVHFTLDPKDWHGTGGEFLWASPTGASVGDEFELENSPFLVKGVSYKDVVKAIPSGDARTYEFHSVVRRAGHSTYRLLVEPDSPKFKEYWNLLEARGCTYESGPIKMNIGPRDHYSVDVPPSADIHQVYRVLEKGERDGAWDFEEGHAHLAQK